MKKDNDVIAQGVHENGVYKFSGTYEVSLMAKNLDNTLWHDQFGHLNYTSLQLMHRLNMVSDLPSIKKTDKVCEA